MENVWRASYLPGEQVHFASSVSGCEYVIFFSPIEGSIPKNNPKKLKEFFKANISKWSEIEDIKHTKTNKVMIKTLNAECAHELCQLKKISEKEVRVNIQVESISSRYLLKEISTDINLEDIAEEIEESNVNMKVHEVNRFVRKEMGTMRKTEMVLVTVYGGMLPQKIHLWCESHNISKFVDNPRQCFKCGLFNHLMKNCRKDKVCFKCGENHEDALCQNTVEKCINCKGPHRADYKECDARIVEKKFLRFKSNNNLTFVEARRRYFKKDKNESTYAAVVKNGENRIGNQNKEYTEGITKVEFEAIMAKQQNIIDERCIQKRDIEDMMKKQEEMIESKFKAMFVNQNEMIEKQNRIIEEQAKQIKMQTQMIEQQNKIIQGQNKMLQDLATKFETGCRGEEDNMMIDQTQGTKRVETTVVENVQKKPKKSSSKSLSGIPTFSRSNKNDNLVSSNEHIDMIDQIKNRQDRKKVGLNGVPITQK